MSLLGVVPALAGTYDERCEVRSKGDAVNVSG